MANPEAKLSIKEKGSKEMGIDVKDGDFIKITVPSHYYWYFLGGVVLVLLMAIIFGRALITFAFVAAYIAFAFYMDYRVGQQKLTIVNRRG
ncbi:hypothetical protein [Ligilactobacillus pobuzihii]|uniref:Uncharacterized protein n=1 Tax=Ligilactobacillus pobuzihii TaxID=449659 RepID=A0A0R2LCF3_9LACO|nr:hypothetical protein [Ligilactobacillus pobuzihii]KRK11041.1 hypothetical protein FD11_GL001313 [Ligilactobacillus pobuzihii E100301 = KCTC 13174]KRN99586.1 hypothetical protein IV66_GL001592 [Ligilactobacillus pobuzihii]